MKQIFNRLSDIAKSYSNSSTNPSADNRASFGTQQPISEDDELSKIIDNLKNDTADKSNYNKNKNNSQQAKSNFTPNLIWAYELFEIQHSSDNDKIKSAYKKMIKEYHPDKVASMGKEIQDLAMEKTKNINQAYNIIEKERGI